MGGITLRSGPEIPRARSAVTFGTHADKLAGGFKLRTASSPYNDSATNNWTATYSTPQKPFVGSNAVPGKAQGNP